MHHLIHLTTCIRFEGSGFPCTEAHRAMQVRALESWARIGAKVCILGWPGHVTWGHIAAENATRPVAAQIDSDIILTDPIRRVFDFLAGFSTPAWATSHRRHFHPGAGLDTGVVEEPYGLSIFVGNRPFWESLLASEVAAHSKLGVGEDAAVCSFGNLLYPDQAFDFTDLACVHHPRHGDRIEHRGDFNAHLPADRSRCGIPPRKIP